MPKCLPCGGESDELHLADVHGCGHSHMALALSGYVTSNDSIRCAGLSERPPHHHCSQPYPAPLLTADFCTCQKHSLKNRNGNHEDDFFL